MSAVLQRERAKAGGLDSDGLFAAVAAIDAGFLVAGGTLAGEHAGVTGQHGKGSKSQQAKNKFHRFPICAKNEQGRSS